jgi:hypothetical protein
MSCLVLYFCLHKPIRYVPGWGSQQLRAYAAAWGGPALVGCWLVLSLCIPLYKTRLFFYVSKRKVFYIFSLIRELGDKGLIEQQRGGWGRVRRKSDKVVGLDTLIYLHRISVDMEGNNYRLDRMRTSLGWEGRHMVTNAGVGRQWRQEARDSKNGRSCGPSGSKRKSARPWVLGLRARLVCVGSFFAI